MTEMAIGRSKNRRRADAGRKTQEVALAVRRHGGSLVRVALAVALTAGGLAGGVRLYQWVRSSPQFAVEQISFTGLHRASEGELLRLAGLAAGQNLFTLDMAAASRAMAAHPWVRSVELERHFPRGLSVRVEEHVPAAMVVLGDLYLVDREGEPFRRVQPGDVEDLPLLSGVDREAYVAQSLATATRLREALEVAEAYAASPAGRGARLSEVRMEEDGLTLVVGKTGQEIRLGEGETAQKLARLLRVRAALESRALVADVIHLENRARSGWVAVKLTDGFLVPGPASERSGGRGK